MPGRASARRPGRPGWLPRCVYGAYCDSCKKLRCVQKAGLQIAHSHGHDHDGQCQGHGHAPSPLADHLLTLQLPTPSLRAWLRDGPFDCAMNPSFLGFFAHGGAMGILQREGLLGHLCGLAGASAGAMMGAFVASGHKILDPSRQDMALSSDMEHVTTMRHRRLSILDIKPGLGVFRGDGLEKELELYCKPTFEDLALPFACTAWSAYGMRTEILTEGSVPRAVRASCTVPGLFQPISHGKKRWLMDGGMMDPSGSIGLSALPKQPDRSLHVVVNRRVLPGLDGRWSDPVPPCCYGATRKQVVTLRLSRPPALTLGELSFHQLEYAILATAEAVYKALDEPMSHGAEEGHYIAEVDVAWPERLRGDVESPLPPPPLSVPPQHMSRL